MYQDSDVSRLDKIYINDAHTRLNSTLKEGNCTEVV